MPNECGRSASLYGRFDLQRLAAGAFGSSSRILSSGRGQSLVPSASAAAGGLPVGLAAPNRTTNRERPWVARSEDALTHLEGALQRGRTAASSPWSWSRRARLLRLRAVWGWLPVPPKCVSEGGTSKGELLIDPVAEGSVHKLVKFVTQRVTRRIITAGVRSNWLTRSGSLTATATTVANADYVESRHLDGAVVQVAGQRATSPVGPRPAGFAST
jgi:hypothetical protein